MRTPYKLIKMMSGEELIATIRKGRNGRLILTRPMMFESTLSADMMGRVKEIFTLRNWIILSSDTTVTISEASVVSISTPSNDIELLYDAEKNKEDTQKLNPKSLKPPTTPKLPSLMDLFGDLPEVSTDYPSSLTTPISKKEEDALFQKMDKMMKDMGMDFNSEKPKKNLAKPDFDDTIVYMNLVFSPNVILKLLKSGMLKRSDLGKIINELTDGNGEGMSVDKFTSKNKKKEDFGNKWTDWNPDPKSNDYQ